MQHLHEGSQTLSRSMALCHLVLSVPGKFRDPLSYVVLNSVVAVIVIALMPRVGCCSGCGPQVTAASAQSSQGRRSLRLLAAGIGRAVRPSTIRSRTWSCLSSSPRSRQAAKTSRSSQTCQSGSGGRPESTGANGRPNWGRQGPGPLSQYRRGSFERGAADTERMNLHHPRHIKAD